MEIINKYKCGYCDFLSTSHSEILEHENKCDWINKYGNENEKLIELVKSKEKDIEHWIQVVNEQNNVIISLNHKIKLIKEQARNLLCSTNSRIEKMIKE